MAFATESDRHLHMCATPRVWLVFPHTQVTQIDRLLSIRKRLRNHVINLSHLHDFEHQKNQNNYTISLYVMSAVRFN